MIEGREQAEVGGQWRPRQDNFQLRIWITEESILNRESMTIRKRGEWESEAGQAELDGSGVEKPGTNWRLTHLLFDPNLFHLRPVQRSN